MISENRNDEAKHKLHKSDQKRKQTIHENEKELRDKTFDEFKSMFKTM